MNVNSRHAVSVWQHHLMNERVSTTATKWQYKQWIITWKIVKKSLWLYSAANFTSNHHHIGLFVHKTNHRAVTITRQCCNTVTSWCSEPAESANIWTERLLLPRSFCDFKRKNNFYKNGKSRRRFSLCTDDLLSNLIANQISISQENRDLIHSLVNIIIQQLIIIIYIVITRVELSYSYVQSSCNSRYPIASHTHAVSVTTNDIAM